MFTRIKKAWDNFPVRFVLPYITYKPRSLKGHIQSGSIITVNGMEQRFRIYLPKNVQMTDERYPVVYHLHGAGLREAWLAADINALAATHEQAVARGNSSPMIIVAPYSLHKFSMWSDSTDGSQLAASVVVRDLIDHIDHQYPTLPDRAHRAIQGFSMGGFGATMMAFKYPELFSKLVSWDGALHNWESLTTTRGSIARNVFGNSDAFDSWSPYALSAAAPAVELEIDLVIGWVVDYGRRFHDHLTAHNIAHSYVETGLPHVLFDLLDVEGDRIFAGYGNWIEHANQTVMTS